MQKARAWTAAAVAAALIAGAAIGTQYQRIENFLRKPQGIERIAYVNATGLNVRSDCGTEYSQVINQGKKVYLNAGDRVVVLGTSSRKDDFSPWYRIRTSGGVEGCIASRNNKYVVNSPERVAKKSAAAKASDSIQSEEIPPSEIGFSLSKGMKVVKAYSVKAGGRNYTFAAAIRCKDEGNWGIPDDDNCESGGYAALFVKDGSSVIRFGADDMADLFRQEELLFELVGGKIHAFSKRFESRWWTMSAYVMGEKGFDKTLFVIGDELFLSEVTGGPPREIVAISRYAYPGEYSSQSEVRYYPQISVSRWDGRTYAEDPALSATLNTARRDVIEITRRAMQGSRAAAESELRGYLSPFNAEMQRVLGIAFDMETGRVDETIRKLEAEAFANALMQNPKFLIAHIIAKSIDDQLKKQEEERAARHGISPVTTSPGGVSQVTIGDRTFIGMGTGTEEDLRKKREEELRKAKEAENRKKEEERRRKCDELLRQARERGGGPGVFEEVGKFLAGCK